MSTKLSDLQGRTASQQSEYGASPSVNDTVNILQFNRRVGSVEVPIVDMMNGTVTLARIAGASELNTATEFTHRDLKLLLKTKQAES